MYNRYLHNRNVQAVPAEQKRMPGLLTYFIGFIIFIAILYFLGHLITSSMGT